MANDNNRKILLDDKLLLTMVQQKGELVERGRAISQQMEEHAKQHELLNDQLTDLMATTNAKKLDIFKRVEKLTKKQLTEFEIPVTTEIQEDGQLVLIVTDALAEFQASFKTFDKFKEPVPRKSK
jgi:hypothetical protein